MSEVIRLSLDTEFNELAPSKEPMSFEFISIGLKNIDNEEDGYYAVSSEFDEKKSAKSNKFVASHVLPKLYLEHDKEEVQQDLKSIRIGVSRYLMQSAVNFRGAKKMELWAKNGSYDNVAICRLLGGMQQFRGTVTMFNMDVKFRDLNELTMPKNPATPKPAGDETRLHNAFYDACHQAEIIRWVEANERPRCSETATMNAAVKKGLAL
ncbi:MAG: hypothetical protein COB76_00050 [Alphaproteobacteria bacterium]|nr:MAG: hypothetical protein COB76_00050 [Alphaproteobacteria bacterium]